MKILQVCPIFPPEKGDFAGGVTQEVHDFSKELVRRGHQVEVYCANALDINRKTAETHALIDGINVHYFNYIAHFYTFFVTPSLIPAVKNNLNSFDIVHIHDFRTFEAAAISHYARQMGIPYVLQTNGAVLRMGNILTKMMKMLFDLASGNKMLRGAHKVIAGCETEVSEYKKMRVPLEQITIIPPAYDVHEYDKLPTRGQFRHQYNVTKKHIILFLGRIHKIKGLDFLVRSFSELSKKRDDVTLVIVGPDDGFKSSLQKLIEDLNLEDNVLFTGALHGQDKLAALVDATMLVQTSTYERGPGSPFEAVLCGTPIIVTKNTGAGEIVEQADAGTLVTYGNIEELTTAMNSIIDNHSTVVAKTNRARDYIINNYSFEKLVVSYLNLYESIKSAKN